MDRDTISRYITDTFDGVETITADDNLFFMYDPTHMFPFATLMTNDLNDTFSNLSRPDAYRLNIGVSRQTFHALFGDQPQESADGTSPYDFTAFDRVMPHPVYGKMYWVCIVNPSPTTFQDVIRPLLDEAYARDVAKHAKRAARS